MEPGTKVAVDELREIENVFFVEVDEKGPVLG